MLNFWDRFWFTPESTSVVALVRVAFGLLVLGWTAALGPDLFSFFSSRGIVAAHPPHQPWGVLGWFPTDTALVVIYVALLAASLCLIVGYHSRLAAFLVFVGVLSFQRRNPFVFNAGELVVRAIAFYLLFAPTGAALSVDRWRTARERFWQCPRRAPWALRLMQIQLSVIYLAAVWAKAQGKTWNDGTAVYYALKLGDLARFSVPSILIDSPVLMDLATYGTLALELALGILVWHRQLRPWVVLVGIAFHLAIDYAFLVGFFSLAMIVCYLAFVSPEYLDAQLERLRRRLVATWGARGAPIEAALTTQERGPSAVDARRGRLTHLRWRGAARVVMFALVTAGVAALVAGHMRSQPPAPGRIAVEHRDGVGDDSRLNALYDVLRTSGLRAAMNELEGKMAGDPHIAAQSHRLAHALGKYAARFYGSTARAMSECGDVLIGGCYHGVLDAHVEASGGRPEHALAACDGDLAHEVRRQCLHGVGQVLDAMVNHNLFRALKLCDELPSASDRSGCYGGVFMQNTVLAAEERSDVRRAAVLMGDALKRRAYVKADDPLYPCNAVAATYRVACFQMQTSNMLLQNGWDVEKAARSCDRAPAQYLGVCYRSLGRDISGLTRQDDARSIAMCSRVATAYRDDCLIGSMAVLLDHADRSLEFCSKVPTDSKSMCYGSLGQHLSVYYGSGPRAVQKCEKGEPAYIDRCVRSARAGL
jgi:hypothetical protein